MTAATRDRVLYHALDSARSHLADLTRANRDRMRIEREALRLAFYPTPIPTCPECLGDGYIEDEGVVIVCECRVRARVAS